MPKIIAAMDFYLGHIPNFPPSRRHPLDPAAFPAPIRIGQELDLDPLTAAYLLKTHVAVTPADWTKADKAGETLGARLTRNHAAAVELCRRAEAEAAAWRAQKAVAA